jgi:hypothetical protein
LGYIKLGYTEQRFSVGEGTNRLGGMSDLTYISVTHSQSGKTFLQFSLCAIENFPQTVDSEFNSIQFG